MRMGTGTQVGGASPQATDDEEEAPVLGGPALDSADTASVWSSCTAASRHGPQVPPPPYLNNNQPAGRRPQFQCIGFRV